MAEGCSFAWTDPNGFIFFVSRGWELKVRILLRCLHWDIMKQNPDASLIMYVYTNIYIYMTCIYIWDRPWARRPPPPQWYGSKTYILATF